MKPFDLAQKIKILRFRDLKVPVMRAASEPYDPELPTKFDKSIAAEIISVNQVNAALIGIIKKLCQIIMTTNTRHTADTWEVLKQCNKLIKESRSSISIR